MRFILFGFAAVALSAAATVLRMHSISTDGYALTAAMPSVHELLYVTNSGKLPVEVAADHPVIYPQRP